MTFCKRLVRISLAMIVPFVFAAGASHAQSSLISGYSIGGGLSLYGGDLDGQPTGAKIGYFGGGNLHLHAGVDRNIGSRFQVKLETQFNRISGQNGLVDGTHNLISFDLDAAVGIGPDNVVKVYAGIGPTIATHSYTDLTTIAVVAGWATEGSTFGMTIPVGVILSDRIRAGFRISMTDGFDGREGGSSKDIFGIVALSYRFQ
ncbi:MAG: outer membrane beta-barrel protein [Rhodothermales bacterium]|nr:outer membrane beta-barrel protein [Rhodothermales bacterium]